MGVFERLPDHRRDNRSDRSAPKPIGQDQYLFDLLRVGKLGLASEHPSLAEQISQIGVDRDAALHAEELDREAAMLFCGKPVTINMDSTARWWVGIPVDRKLRRWCTWLTIGM